jgi:coenzyme F420-0:L-glutamate ligase/coenzyme F420-1:gamma-L-glutamate ligase
MALVCSSRDNSFLDETAVIELHPLSAIGEVVPGDDLGRLLAEALKTAQLLPQPYDVLLVTQKIVSKAEGRFVDLATVTPSARALELAQVTRKDARYVELVLAESTAVVRAVPNVLITRHRSGCVMANSGIDRSNIGPAVDGVGASTAGAADAAGGAAGGPAARAAAPDRVLLLPVDADASAARLRAGLANYWAPPPAVLISDSFGRPWRYGVTNVAIGACGLPSLIDRRGEADRNGRPLEVTQVALGDMIASAAGLVTGEGAEGVPAVLVRGLRWDAEDRPATALVRPLNEDLFQ